MFYEIFYQNEVLKNGIIFFFTYWILGYFAIAKYLIQKGADVNSKSTQDNTPLDIAATKGVKNTFINESKYKNLKIYLFI